jgi:hypothetical protein
MVLRELGSRSNNHTGEIIMTTKNESNRIMQEAADQKLMDGIKKHESTLTSFTVAGATYKTADILGILQQRLTTAHAAESTRAAWLTAVKANKDERAKTRPVVSGVRQTIQVMFAGSTDTLAEFGLKPRKPRALRTPEQKAESVIKGKATRAARHTAGPKQKAKIKGTAPQAAPATAPAATATVTAPVAAAAPATAPAAPPVRPPQ